LPRPKRDAQVLKLDEALEELAKFDQRKAQIVELRFFAGLNFEEIAVVLKVSSRTIVRDWSVSKAWLAREMVHGTGG
jgi:RNA polymerase sigma-70 factor, ECF subfamily